MLHHCPGCCKTREFPETSVGKSTKCRRCGYTSAIQPPDSYLLAFACPSCSFEYVTDDVFATCFSLCPKCHGWASTDLGLFRAIQNNSNDVLRIREILEASKISDDEFCLSDTINRTFTLSGYQAGHEAERITPAVLEDFPVWRWDIGGDYCVKGPHRHRADRVYPGTVSFQEVRGWKFEDILKCSCLATAMYIDDWNELRKHGKRLSRKKADGTW